MTDYERLRKTFNEIGVSSETTHYEGFIILSPTPERENDGPQGYYIEFHFSPNGTYIETKVGY